ncbi:MAG: hypothetical protein MMC33_001182 [Icmadophila ericetorum]|nr:hypothetical protein [Icmadophila ericetorum]
MSVYLYGKPEGTGSIRTTPTLAQYHIDHILTRAPNISLSASNIQLNLGGSGKGKDSKGSIPSKELSRGCIFYLTQIHEAFMQPFLKTLDLLQDSNASFFFERDGVLM